MPNFCNDIFGLLLMIDVECLRFEYKLIFVIIGPKAKLNYFCPNI
jgi:hypothetical protein